MRGVLLIAAALLLAAAEPKPAPLLTAADLDPALVLPPPPARGSAQERAELAELHAQEPRGADDEAAARLDGDTKDASIFAEAIGPGFDLTRLPATAQLMALVRASEKEVVDRGKAEFRRERPYAADPTLNPCKRNDDLLSSYPSGHTSRAYAYGETLARLLPAHAPAILARAARYGQTRITCEQHFRSDVGAGAVLGTLVAERLRGKPAFDEAYRAAAAELATAGVR